MPSHSQYVMMSIETVKRLIEEMNPSSMSDYQTLSKKIIPSLAQIGNKVKIALLTSFTTTGLADAIMVKAASQGIAAEVYVAPYGQYAQEILDNNSKLYAWEPDVVILWIETRALMGDSFLNPYSRDAKQIKAFFTQQQKQIQNLVTLLVKRTNAVVLLHDLSVPVHSPLGILENKQENGMLWSLHNLNAAIKQTYRNDKRVFVVEYDAFCSRIGKEQAIDYKLYYLGDIQLKFDLLPKVASLYIPFLRAMKGMSKKCLVLDLDNTLWGGILGEDGIENIKLGPTPEGRPFMEFQRMIAALHQKGVILAINSKNNPADVKEMIRKHPFMVLKEDNFAAMRINWNNKASNIKEIAQELNIGLDSMVFMDDDPVNRVLVRKELPGVFVVDMPADPAYYCATLMGVDSFDTLQITEEDKKRGIMYAQERRRSELGKTASNIDDFLKSLMMKITIEKASKHAIPRISQLTMKTNQFNMTTKRYSEQDIINMISSKKFLIATIRAEDTFGDNGIVGLAIVKKGTIWYIDTFLLSCRVIGRKIEDTLLQYIYRNARKEGASAITAGFISTKKNAPAGGFYKKSGFILKDKENGQELWGKRVPEKNPYATYIKVIEK